VSNSGHHMCVLAQYAPFFAVTCAPNRYLENSVEFNSTMQHILAEQPVPM
jgi:hypothetical protein